MSTGSDVSHQDYMSPSRGLPTLALLLTCLAVASPPAGALTIEIGYTAIDVVDDPSFPGEDRWQYDYTVTGSPFAPGDSIEILFPWQEFGRLEAVPISNAPAVWTTFTLDGNAATDIPGTFLAVSDTGTTGTAQHFAVSFTWLSSGAPGSQDFSVYDEGFNLITSGTTVAAPPIPEPQTAVLLAAGLALLALATYRRRTWSIAPCRE